MVDNTELLEMLSLLDKLHAPYYIHAGYALHLHGIEGELDDCDIRVYHHDIMEMYRYLSAGSMYTVELLLSKKFEKGVYESKCITVYSSKTKFDICTNMVTLCDMGRFEFPFEECFNDIVQNHNHGRILPVASLENLLLYYLVYRRTSYDGKNDNKRIADLISNDKFSRKKFEELVSSLHCSEKILALFAQKLPH